MTLSQEKSRGMRRGMVGALTVACVAAAALGINCDDDNGTTASVTTSDIYPYDYYYVGDVSVSDAYWADSWYVDPFYFATSLPIGQVYGGGGGGGSAGGGVDAGVTPVTPSDGGIVSGSLASAGVVLRELARGANLCPGQVTIAPKTTTACSFTGGPGTVRTGATVTFNGCTLSDGGRLDGVVDVTATPVPSDPSCGAGTTINVTYTSTLTNFTYTGPNGGRVVIPSLTNMGSYSRGVTMGPTSIAIATNGTLQRYDTAGVLIADHSLSGSRNYTIANNGAGVSFSVDGALTVQDRTGGGNAATVTGTGVTRTNTCCRPTGGTIVVSGTARSTSTWVFGPSCGQATLDGSSVTLSACQ
jgi:hypothetical protein